MSLIKKMCPICMVLPIQKVMGAMQTKVIKYNKKLLKQMGSQNKSLWSLAECGNKYTEFIKEYVNCDIDVKKKGITLDDVDNPIVVCVVKNDIIRIKLFINYYRQIGVQQFAILDDNSSDGTKEFLMEQPDVTVLHTKFGYTTLRRQVWVTKIIDLMGRKRWYLIVDSDELFDYRNSDHLTLKQFARKIKNNGQTRVKALLLDMFAEDSLYSEKIEKPEDIPIVCRRFLPNYKLEKTLYDIRIRGGARSALAKGIHNSPLVSKYPLLFADEDDIIINSHYNYPFVRNKPNRPSTVLRHYKFIPGDRERYQERIKKKNFYNNSKDYKMYLEFDEKLSYKKIVSEMKVYQDFSSTDIISIMEEC